MRDFSRGFAQGWGEEGQRDRTLLKALAFVVGAAAALAYLTSQP